MIEKACQAVRDGKYHDQFRVDWYQGGAGTSTNMNANEVLANVALELAGHNKGELRDRRAARRPEHVAVDERLVPHRDQGRPHPAQRQAGRGAGAARRLLPRQGQRVHEDRQDGPHGAAGRGPHDGGPGVPRLRRVAGRRDPAPARRGEVPLRGQHGRHRHRHRPQRARRATRERCADHLAKLTGKPIVPAKDMLAATWDQQGFVVYSARAQERGDQALQDRQRPDPARLRPPRGAGRDQPAGDAAGLLDHAGQGQSGHPRAGEPGRLPRDGQRLHGDPGRAQRTAPAERLRAGGRVWR